MSQAAPYSPHHRLLPALVDIACILLAAASFALLLAHLIRPLPAGWLTFGTVALALLCLLLLMRNRQRCTALLRSRENLNHAQAVAHVGSWHLRGRRGRLEWSDETYRIFGMEPDTPVNYEVFLECVHPDDRARVEHAWKQAVAGAPYDIEHRILANGELRWVRERAECERTADGHFLGATGTVQDVTARREAEEALRRSRQHLRALGAHHERLVEEERAHIAREIHDELGQYLTALRMDAAMLELGLAHDNPRAAQRLGSMKALIDETIQSVRRVASTLRPTALDLGLESGIEWLVDDFQERSRIACVLQVCERGLPEVDDTRATLVFRILQEALTNVARHADARTAAITLDVHDGALRLQVRDDGRGFDPGTPGERRTFGLLGMHERAMVFGGGLRIDSAPGRGTTVLLSVPLDDQSMSRDEFPETCAGCPLMEAAVEQAEPMR